jgi:hypothetical protein
MKIYWFCRIFGHKFSRRCLNHGRDFYDFCTHCGLSKEEIKASET